MKKDDISEEGINDMIGLTHIAINVSNKEIVNQLTEQITCDGYKVVSKPRITGDGYYKM